MKVHTTNYQNAFIEAAEDCPVQKGEVPPVRGTRTVANIQFDILIDHPYEFTSDDVLFQVYAIRNNIKKADLKKAREEFFSKGQPCFRTSPLTKRYGWGVHNDEAGKIAIYACETPEYRKLSRDKTLQIVKAMRSKR